MSHPNNQALFIIGSGVGVLALAVITAGILTRHSLIRRRRALDNAALALDAENPGNMEYLVSHNAQGF